MASIGAVPPVIDPLMAAQYGYAQLLHGAGTRKNATRESTAPLKEWLKSHQKNPYPTKGEKIMLALVSGKSEFMLIFVTSKSRITNGVTDRNDIDPSIHLVRQRSAATEERKQVEPRRRI